MAVSIPSHTAWFDDTDVHEIERKALPEWFQPGSLLKTPKTYIQARNFIVNMYREQPSLYLTVTECRRHISVDVSAVMRLHDFLEHWGLINYLSQRPQASSSRSGGAVVLDGPAGAAVAATAPLARSSLTPRSISLSTRANLYAAVAASGSGAAAEDKEWSNESILALLEGLEQFEDRWEDVAAHVGRTPEECVRQFLRLPLEEPYQPEALLANAVDPQACQLALLAAAVRGDGGGAASGSNGAPAPGGKEVEVAAAAAASGLREAAQQMLQALQQNAQQQIAEEEHEIHKLCAAAVDTQLHRLEAKLGQVDELAALLQREREQLERTRQQIYAERLQLDRKRLTPAGAPAPTQGVVAVPVAPPQAAQPRTS